jgi:hypothetical protein
MTWSWGSGLLVATATSLASCSNATPNQGAGSDGSAPTEGTTAGDAGGAAPTDASAGPTDSGSASATSARCAAPKTLAGTWDVQGSRSNAAQTSATVVIDGSHFTFAVTGGDSLSFSEQAGTLSLTWQDEYETLPIATTQTSAALSEGIIPLGIGGAWTFTSHSSGCTANIAPSQLGATCSGVEDLPAPLPYRLEGTATGQRTATASSVFGDLGGVWHITAGSAAGDATFRGNTFSVVWSGDPWGDGNVSVVFCDGMASGTTSDGVEFSAHRR